VERSTFQAADAPDNQFVFSSWKYSLCSRNCLTTHSSDRSPILGHPTFTGMKFENVTLTMCTIAFRDCDSKCQQDLATHLNAWPKPGTKWPYLTSSQLPNSVGNCTTLAANDDDKLLGTVETPPNVQQHGTSAYCNENLSGCTRECHTAFNKEIVDFQKSLD
jgi:hypothetical protein